MTKLSSPLLHTALSTLLRELAHGAGDPECWVLNRNDAGLLTSLDKVPATTASAPSPAGGASIAAHVDHLRYGFSLLNRWAAGEENPYADADFSASWKKGTVSDPEWTERKAALRHELAQAERVIATPRDLGRFELTGVISVVVHLAYHLGAIRQIHPAVQGPRATD